MVNTNNPAGRLYTVLREAEAQNHNEQTLKIWAQVFNVPANDELEIIRCILSLQELVD